MEALARIPCLQIMVAGKELFNYKMTGNKARRVNNITRMGLSPEFQFHTRLEFRLQTQQQYLENTYYKDNMTVF